MSVDRRLTAFFDAAVEQYLLSTSDRVLGELTVRRAGLSGETAMPIAVAVALLARARDDGHSALSLSDLAAEATELARELAAAVGTDASGALMHEREPAWWRAMLIAVPSVVQGANSSAASPLVLHGSLVQFRRYFDAEQRIAAHLRMSLAHGEPTFRVITGGPGTGKTTRIAELLIDTLARDPARRVALAAPTGKAAARLSESVRLRLDGMNASPDVRARVPQRATTIGVPLAAMRKPASRARADSAPEPARIKTGAPGAAAPDAMRPFASARASSAIASPPLARSCSEVCPSRSAFASIPRIAAIETAARSRCLRHRVATGPTHAEICSGLTTPRTLGREGRFNMSRG